MATRSRIREDGPPVNSGTVSFDADGRLSAWETVPVFGGPSLEDHIWAGDEEERRSARNKGHPYAVPVSVAKIPSSPWLTLHWLTRCAPTRRVPTIGAASRYAARAGLGVLRRIEALAELTDLWELAYSRGSAAQRALLSNQSYEGFVGIDSSHVRARKLSLFFDDEAEVATIAAGLGLPVSTVALGAVVAGLAQSTEFVPEPYLSTFARAVVDFCQYLERRVADLRPLLGNHTPGNEA